MAEKISSILLYGLMMGMLLTGTCNTIFLKLQNNMKYKDSTGEKVKFNHAFFQTFVMFIGEFMCLIAYMVSSYFEKRKYGDLKLSPAMKEAKEKGLKTNINVFLLAIPAAFDVCASSMLFLALVLIQASIYQMMRGMIVFIAAIFSVIFLKRRYYRHHWISLVFVVAGVGIVGASPIIYPDDSDKSSWFTDEEGGKSNVLLGIGLVVTAQLFTSSQFVIEEKLLGNYYLHPLKVVGWEGLWGCLIYIILLPIMQFIPCHIEDI
jgi:drug/metabolite transporter (DMT)-like permease